MTRFQSSPLFLLCSIAAVATQLLFVAPAMAQVFGLGPSNPTLFDNVMIAQDLGTAFVGDSIGDDGLTTQLNVLESSAIAFEAGGGIVVFPGALEVNNGAEVNFIGSTTPALRSNATVVSANSGSEANILGGLVESVNANAGGVVNIDGGVIGSGVIGDGVRANEDGEVNIRGGDIQNVFLEAFGRVNLFVDAEEPLFLGGIPAAPLLLNMSTLVATRDANLSGVLVDGTPFSLDLNTFNVPGEDFFDPLSLLFITAELVSELDGDFDEDETVDGSDFLLWQRTFSSITSLDADANSDGIVNGGQI